MLNTPLLLLMPLTLTPLSTSRTLYVLLCSWVWVVSGSIAAYTPPPDNFLPSVIAQVFMFLLMYVCSLYAPSLALADLFTLH